MVAGVTERLSVVQNLRQQAMDLSEKVLGKEHPVTLSSVYCVAYALSRLEAYDEALSLYSRALDGYIRALGPAHLTPATRLLQATGRGFCYTSAH